MRSRPLRSLLFAAALATLPALAVTQSGCAKTTQPMHSGGGVPASEGTVRATEGDDGNTDVTILVKHLAHPSKVQSDATVYVVWIQPRGGQAQNVGSLRVDDDLEGRFDGMTPHPSFRVAVTPEPSGTVDTPTHPPVFTAEVERGQ